MEGAFLMASTPSTPIVSSFDLTTSFQTLYTVPAPYNRVSIDAAVFNNYSSSNATFTVRIVQSGTSDSLDEIITAKQIRAQSNDLAPSLIGQALLQGATIEAKASANTSVNCHITATLIT
jgi:hypothetical protein